MAAAVRPVNTGLQPAGAGHAAVPRPPLGPRLRDRRVPAHAPELLRHRQDRFQRVQQQILPRGASTASPTRWRRSSTHECGPGSTSGRPTSPAPRSARRSPTTSRTTTSSPASDAAPRPRVEATAPTAAPPPRSWCGRGGGAVTDPRARRACARSARGGTRRTAGSGRCSACGSSPRARRTSERAGNRRPLRERTRRSSAPHATTDEAEDDHE